MTVKELIEFLQTCPEGVKVMFWTCNVRLPLSQDEVRYNDVEQRVEIW